MKALRKTLTIYDDYYDMIADKVRMDSYRKAIFEVVSKGDVVVDLGAGLGVLSFFALQAGASRVYAIEKMDSVNLAERIAAINGFTDRMVFINEISTRVDLPEKADVLVSETLGSFAVDENTLPFTIDARKRFVKEGGRLVPGRLKLWLVPVEAPAAYRKIDIWKSVDGIDFSPAREEFSRKLLVEEITPGNYLAEPAQIAKVDLFTAEKPFVTADAAFITSRPGTLHGFGGWFECQMAPGVSFDTSPASPTTHWKQAFFPAKEPVRVGAASRVALNMRVGAKTRDGDGTTISYDFACFPNVDISGGKVGRNDPCPCGSGRKYKKCCGF